MTTAHARRAVPRFPTVADAPPGGMEVVHLTAECWPFARTGGLGEAVRTLAQHQVLAGQAATVVMPLYRAVRDAGHALVPLAGVPDIPVRLGTRDEWVGFRRSGDAAPRNAPRFIFVEHPAFVERAGIYGEQGVDYSDNVWRYALFVMAALSALPRIAPEARVLHAHDWHAALAPAYLRTHFGLSPYHRRLGAVLSVHNAGFQGHCVPESMATLGLPASLYDWRLFEWHGRVNLLKGGLAFADLVTTVSPTHAAELRTELGGFGLHGAFDALGARLVGILNGIDQAAWDPATDPSLPARFSAGDLSGKRCCKAALQQAFGLPPRDDVPIVAMCARLAAQKGYDVLLGSRALADEGTQFVFVGQGEERFRQALAERASAAPHRIAARFDFGDALEHLLLAGADLCLMPSSYEPCGLTQMRAQRYGTIPVAHRIGGLADTIEHGVTGFLFAPYTTEALDGAMALALAHFAQPATWRRIVGAAMARDFGWKRSVAEYAAAYDKAVARRGTRPPDG